MKATVTIATYKANPTIDPIPDAVIAVTEKLPWHPFTEPLETWDRIFDEQATAIEEALHNSLPGGTYDRLAARMLSRKSSHLTVAFGEPKENER